MSFTVCHCPCTSILFHVDRAWHPRASNVASQVQIMKRKRTRGQLCSDLNIFMKCVKVLLFAFFTCIIFSIRLLSLAYSCSGQTPHATKTAQKWHPTIRNKQAGRTPDFSTRSNKWSWQPRDAPTESKTYLFRRLVFSVLSNSLVYNTVRLGHTPCKHSNHHQSSIIKLSLLLPIRRP